MGYLEDLFGAASSAAPEISTGTDNRFAGFSKEQVDQLLMAEKQGVFKTECAKHKEWSPTLMNLYWCREKDNDKPESVYKLAQFLQEYFPRQDGFVGTSLDIMCIILKCYDNDGTPYVPDLLSDGGIDEEAYMFKMIAWELGGLDAEYLLSGRYRLTDHAGYDVLEHVMAEGDKEVYNIISRLQGHAQAKASDIGSSDFMVRMANNAWNRMSIMLRFDDMNIRGYQIKYALEYADGSDEKLFQIINDKRDADLCRYINKRSAEDYKSGIKAHNQIAVTSGASFMHKGNDSLMFGLSDGVKELILNPLNVDSYLSDDIEALKVDYSTLDIQSNISTSTAMKICEARGFKLIRDIPRRAQFGDKVHCYIFFNKLTNDYVVARSATDDNFVCGGANLIMHRDVEKCQSSRPFWYSSSGGPHKGQHGRAIEISNDVGLFEGYVESMECLPDQPYDWSAIGFTWQGIPIPEYVELPFMRDDDLYSKIGSKLGEYFANTGRWTLGKILNAMLLLSDDEMIKAVPEHYGLYPNWYFEQAGVLNTASWFAADDSKAAVLLSIVKTYLKMPYELVNRIVDGGRDEFKKRDKRDNEGKSALQAAISRNKNEKQFLHTVNEWLYKFGEEDIKPVIKAFNLPDPRELPVRPYWLK